MGYAGKLQEKTLAIQFRKKGLSYKEIQHKVNVSKDSLSRWCRDVILSPDQLEHLRERKLKGSEKGRIVGAKRQQEQRIARTNELRIKGKSEIGKLSNRDMFIAGVALYLGDGCKSDKGIGFSNSNPKIIKFMMEWFRKYCIIPEEKFRGQIWIHNNLNEPEAKKFWSELTQIKLAQFQKSYISVNKNNSNKIRKQIHKHGVFAIRVHSAEKQRKILGWMAGILNTKSI